MGFYAVEINIRGVRSAHNSLQDRLDEVKWKWLFEKVEDLVDSSEFDSLKIELEGPTEL